MFKRVLQIFAAFVAILVLLLLAGFLLPGEWAAEESIVINAESPAVHEVVADLTKWKEWTTWNAENYPTLKYEYGDITTGTGAVQMWSDEQMGAGRLEITQSNPATGIEYDLHFGTESDVAKGTIQYQPARGGTKVHWSATGPLGSNPLSRWFGLMLSGMIASDFQQGLEKLKEKVESAGSQKMPDENP